MVHFNQGNNVMSLEMLPLPDNDVGIIIMRLTTRIEDLPFKEEDNVLVVTSSSNPELYGKSKSLEL